MSAWNHPCCDACWKGREPRRVPVRLSAPNVERCSFCGEPTMSGIYVREDPATVPFPPAQKEEAPR